ncbi:MAG: hypothetical protein WB630_14135, partial [Candidatus Acidiferrales bacterium]
ASPDRCTAALLLDVDPVGLVRTRRGPSGEGGMLEQYVNDRPYPELVRVLLPLTARIAAPPCRGGEEFVRRLFEPLGYRVSAEHHPLDEKFPEWGKSPYYERRLFSELLFMCVTLSCLAVCIHQLGVAHQSSLRSPSTTMSYSISLDSQPTAKMEIRLDPIRSISNALEEQIILLCSYF